jgi:hypothetical protein
VSPQQLGALEKAQPSHRGAISPSGYLVIKVFLGASSRDHSLNEVFRTNSEPGIRPDSVSGVERICVDKLQFDRAKVIADQETGADIDAHKSRLSGSLDWRRRESYRLSEI